jgi:hypothetical protein
MMCLDEWGETYLKGNPTAEGETAVFRAFATLTDDYANHLDQFSGFFWEMTAIHQQVDWNIYNGYPVSPVVKDLGYFTLEPTHTKLRVIDIRPNTVIAKDSLWQLDIIEPE